MRTVRTGRIIIVWWTENHLVDAQSTVYSKIYNSVARKKNKLNMYVFAACPISMKPKSKPNLSLYSLYYAEACNEFAGPISASLCPCNTASNFRKNVAAVASRRQHCAQFEDQTSHSRDERVTARPIGRSETRSTCLINHSIYFCTLHLNSDCCCYFCREKTSNTIDYFITQRCSNRISESDRVSIFFTNWTIFSIWYIRWAIAVVKAENTTIYCHVTCNSRSSYGRNYLQIHNVCSNYIPGQKRRCCNSHWLRSNVSIYALNT